HRGARLHRPRRRHRGAGRGARRLNVFAAVQPHRGPGRAAGVPAREQLCGSGDARAARFPPSGTGQRDGKRADPRHAHGAGQPAMAGLLRRRSAGRVFRAARLCLAAVVRGAGARADLELRGGPCLRGAQGSSGSRCEARIAAPARDGPRPAVAAEVRRPAPRIRRQHARGDRQLRDRRGAARDALEAVAEPRAARAGAGRCRAAQVGGFSRARARRIDAQAPRRGVMRLFFAVWPPPAAARALADWARAAARESGGRATAAEKIHLTLAFLGEAKPQKALAAARRVNANKFNLKLDQAVYWQRNRIVWAGPQQPPPELLTMAETLQRELYREEFILERREFAAHVTLVRKAPAPGQLPELPILQWPVNEFVLVRSISGRYEPLERFPIA